MKFFKMDDLKAAIVSNYLFCYMPKEMPRYGLLVDNQLHVEIMQNQTPIKRAEFEKDIPSNTMEECIFKALYLKKVEEELVISN